MFFFCDLKFCYDDIKDIILDGFFMLFGKYFNMLFEKFCYNNLKEKKINVFLLLYKIKYFC